MTSFFVVWLFNTLARLPLWTLHKLGRLLGWATYLLSGQYAERMRENLENFNAGRHPPELQKLLRASVEEAGKSFS